MLKFQNTCQSLFFMFILVCAPYCGYSESVHSTEIVESEEAIEDIVRENDLLRKRGCRLPRNFTYYLNISDFIQSFIEIPTSNVLVDSSTLSSTYLAGRAPLYNSFNLLSGTCSASFLCMQNANGIYTDIANYISVDNGLIITWFTPTTLINLELDTILHSMVTECIVTATTKVGFNPFYGKKYNMIVSSDNERIYFNLTEI